MAGLSALIAACGIAGHVELLEAIVRVESGGNPIALAVNGAVELVRSPRDREEASKMAHWLTTHGYNFDAGLAQVNSTNLARLGLDTSSVFEPCANLGAASRVLEECYGRALQRWDDEARAMVGALSCYNTGTFTLGVANGYVDAVKAAASSLTPQSNAAASAQSQPGQHRSAQRSARRPAVARRIVDAATRDEVFALAMVDVFDAKSREERAR